jgi:hypothetical protein
MSELQKLATVMILLLSLTSCGGSSSSDDDDPPALANCVLGTSEIGDCKI